MTSKEDKIFIEAHEEEILLLVHPWLDKYFQEDNDFDKFYLDIKEGMKATFLRIGHFYNAYMCDLLKTDSHIESQFGFLSFFCAVEGLMGGSGYVPLDQWLNRHNESFPICSSTQLNKIAQEYYKEQGSKQRTRIFFIECLDKEDKIVFISKFDLIGADTKNQLSFSKSLDAQWVDEQVLARVTLAYDMRNRFVHGAVLAQVKSGRTSFVGTNISNKDVIISFSLNDLYGIFERGYLRYFGYQRQFPHDAYQTWLEEQATSQAPTNDDLYFNELDRIIKQAERLKGHHSDT